MIFKIRGIHRPRSIRLLLKVRRIYMYKSDIVYDNKCACIILNYSYLYRIDEKAELLGDVTYLSAYNSLAPISKLQLHDNNDHEVGN